MQANNAKHKDTAALAAAEHRTELQASNTKHEEAAAALRAELQSAQQSVLSAEEKSASLSADNKRLAAEHGLMQKELAALRETAGFSADVPVKAHIPDEEPKASASGPPSDGTLVVATWFHQEMVCDGIERCECISWCFGVQF